MARMDIDQTLKKLAQHFQVSMLFPAKITIMLRVPKKLCYLLHNSTRAFCVWVKVLSNNFS